MSRRHRSPSGLWRSDGRLSNTFLEGVADKIQPARQTDPAAQRLPHQKWSPEAGRALSEGDVSGAPCFMERHDPCMAGGLTEACAHEGRWLLLGIAACLFDWTTRISFSRPVCPVGWVSKRGDFRKEQERCWPPSSRNPAAFAQPGDSQQLHCVGGGEIEPQLSCKRI